jgi:ABC-type sugar transport system ATPase subunit
VFAVTQHVTVLRDGNVVASRPTSMLDMSALTTLMVGSALKGAERPPSRAKVDEPALELVDLTVAGRQPVSLVVRSGEILGVAGLVGSGRSRLARAMAGDVKSAGTIKVKGRSRRIRSPEDAARAGILYLPEDRKRNGLVLTLNVGANLVLTALDRSLSRTGLVRRRARKGVIAQLIQRFGILPPDPERLVKTLSGGNQQKVLLARAFAAQAQVVILDQPTAGVDVGAKTEIYEQIWEMAGAGLALVIISDDLDELMRLSDRVMVMHAGTVTGIAEVGAFTRPQLLQTITTGRLGQLA